MFGILQEEKGISIIMFSLLGVSILSRILLGALYHGMIKEADNMATTTNKLLRQCKLKFANCYQLSGGVSNISVFVDKFIQRLSFGPLSFNGMYHLSGQSMLLSVVVAGVGICKGIVQGKTLGDILPFYIISFIGLYLFFSVSGAVDIRSQKNILKINLIDYLENHLLARMEATTENIAMLYGENGIPMPAVSSKKGKKTVELMPIGGKLSITEPQKEKLSVQTAGENSRLGDTRVSRPEELGTLDYRADTKISKEELEALLEEFIVI